MIFIGALEHIDGAIGKASPVCDAYSKGMPRHDLSTRFVQGRRLNDQAITMSGCL